MTTTQSVLAQLVPAELVADMATEPPERFFPQLGELSSLGTAAIFVYDDGLHGLEPWISDGTTEGTRLLADICPGLCSSSPRSFNSDGETTFFLAGDGNFDRILFATRGDRVTRIDAESSGGLVLNGGLYRSVATAPGSAENQLELWRTDASSGLSEKVVTLCDSSCGPGNAGIDEAGGIFFFSTSEGYTSYSLGAYRPGNAPIFLASVRAEDFVALPNGKIVFKGTLSSRAGRPPEPSHQIWVTDGTPAGTKYLRGPYITRNLVPFGDKVFFTSLDIVYETDGTSAGTHLAGDLAMPNGIPYALVGQTPQALFFTANGRLFAFTPGVGSRQVLDVTAGVLGVLPDQRALLARATQGSAGDLWVSDGSPAGTQFLTSVPNLEGVRASTSGGVLFSAGTYRSLWRSDGTALGTEPVAAAIPPASSQPRLFATSTALYATTAGEQEPNLFAIDETGGGAQLLSSHNYRPLGALPSSLLLVDRTIWNVVARRGDDFETVLEIWAQNPSPPSADGRLFFSDAGPGQKLWQSDGTAAGTQELTDTLPGYNPGCIIPSVPEECLYDYPRQMTPSGRHLYFEAHAYGQVQVHAYDRQSGETRQLTAFTDWDATALVFEALPEGRLAFLRLLKVRSPQDPFLILHYVLELWVSDGTAEGTYLVATLNHDKEMNLASSRRALLGSSLLFRVPFADHEELWSSNMTAAGTRRIASFRRLDNGAQWLTLGAGVYFPAATAAQGFELWQSDGSPEGTRLLREISSGPAGSNPQNLTSLGDGRFAFAADDGVHGHELWLSDGSAPGTHLLADVEPGPRAGSPSELLRRGDTLYFQAGRRDLGRELFSVALPPPLPPCAQDRLCLRDGRFEVTVEVKTPAGEVVDGQRVLSAEAAGMFSFFSPGNWEMMVKVLDGCALNDRFWVFAAAATDLETTLRVVDLMAGEEKVWHAPAGPARAIADTDAFATCGGSTLLRDRAVVLVNKVED